MPSTEFLALDIVYVFVQYALKVSLISSGTSSCTVLNLNIRMQKSSFGPLNQNLGQSMIIQRLGKLKKQKTTYYLRYTYTSVRILKYIITLHIII